MWVQIPLSPIGGMADLVRRLFKIPLSILSRSVAIILQSLPRRGADNSYFEFMPGNPVINLSRFGKVFFCGNAATKTPIFGITSCVPAKEAFALALCPHCGNPIDITISVNIQQADATKADASNSVYAALEQALPVKSSSSLPLTQKKLIERLQAVIPERDYWTLTDLNHRLSRYAKASDVKAALKILEANGQIEIEAVMNRQIVRWRPQGTTLSEAQKATLLARAAQYAGLLDEEDLVEPEPSPETESGEPLTAVTGEPINILNAFDLIAREAEEAEKNQKE